MTNISATRRGLDIALLILCLFAAIGSVTIFEPCGPRPDGSFMVCHWAGRAITGTGIALALQAAFHLLAKSASVKLGISISMIPTTLLLFAIPHGLIDLCMREEMHCHTVMAPAVTVLTILLLLLLAADIFFQRERSIS